MLEALRRIPSVGSYTVEPLSVDEIDAHPDADRIWATITAAANGTKVAIAEYEEDTDKAVEDAVEDENERCEGLLLRWSEKILDEAAKMHGSKVSEFLTDQLEQAGDVL